MRKIFLSLWLVGLLHVALQAQILTPGNGNQYTLEDMANGSLGQGLTMTAPNVYLLTEDLTIAAGDTLLMDAALQQWQVADTVTITIKGSVQCEERDSRLLISGQNLPAATTFFEWRFEQAEPSALAHLCIEYAKDIYIDETPLTIDDCEFRYFSSQVIKFSRCNPIIENSYFHHNQSAAINSAANVTGSPIIRNNHFYHNVVSNVNQPQINLGPGSATDTILIENNRIDGHVSMSGGISIANLVNISNTKAILRGNLIINNRYGYNQQGTNIFAIIEDNQFVNNNLETNPMNGGSGISIYGVDTTCAAKIRRNIITGNLWGITAIYHHAIDMGTATDYGYNYIYGNSNNSQTHALYNNAYRPLTAIGNYWGDNDAEFAESVIFHQPDQANLGLVTYQPILMVEPTLWACDAHESDGEPFVGVLSTEEPYTFVISIEQSLATIDTALWRWTLEVPPTVTYTLTDEVLTATSWRRTYLLTTPHGTTQAWNVIVTNPATAIANYESHLFVLYPNPIVSSCTVASEHEIELVRIVDLRGACVWQRWAEKSRTIICGLAELPQGIYLMEVYVRCNGVLQKQVRKVIKQ